MEDNVKVFNPIGKSEKINEVQELRENIKRATEITKVNVDTGDLMDKLHLMVVDYNRKFMEIKDYISQYYGKFINMKFSYNQNYGEDRETNPKWYCDYEINIMPYRYINENACLFGMICQLNDDYQGGLKDSSINLRNLVENHKLEIKEITESNFYADVARRAVNCLKQRVVRMKSDDYTFDAKNGYKHKSNFNNKWEC